MRALVTAVLLILVAVPARAQWRPAGPSSGTPNLFARNSRYVFTADDDGVVYRSATDGRTWTGANPTLPAKGNPRGRITGLAANERGVGLLDDNVFYRSVADGATWARVATLPATMHTPIHLVSTRSGAFAALVTATSNSTRRLGVSVDNGATWALRDSVFRGTNRDLIAVGDTLVRIYERSYRQAGGAFALECGVAISFDLGVGWALRPVNPSCFGSFPGGTAGAVGLAYADGRLYAGNAVSLDFGLTWGDVSSAPSFGVVGIAARAGVVVACTQVEGRCGALIVKAGTADYVPPPTGPSSGLPSSNPFSTGRAFLLGLEGAGVLRSEDGVTWAPSGRLPLQHNGSLIALTTHRDLLVGGSGVQRFHSSADRGATWRTTYRQFPSLDEPRALLSADSVLLAGGAEGVYKSRDLGMWTRIAATPRNTSGFFRAGGRTYLTATDGLYTTTTNGTSWTRVLDHNLNQADFGVAGDRVIVNGGNGSVRSPRVSLDGGRTWPAIPSRMALDAAATRQAFLATASNFAAFGGGTFERSPDGGLTWTNIKPLLADSLAPLLIENFGDTLLALGPAYFAASLDHGTTWRKAPHAGLPFAFTPGSEVNAPALALLMRDTVYVAFSGQGVWKRSLADVGLATAAAAGERPGRTALAVAPNPARGPVSVTVTMAATGRARVVAYDVLGRAVAVLHDGVLGAGAHALSWADDVPAGLYVVRAETPDGPVTRTVTRVR